MKQYVSSFLCPSALKICNVFLNVLCYLIQMVKVQNILEARLRDLNRVEM